MNRHKLLVLAALALGATACADGGPTAPSTEPGLTTLSVEPDAVLVPDDPTGLVNLAVWPHEAGGQISIEICVDAGGDPIAAAFDPDLECEAQGGRWSIARDKDGVHWVGRTWPGYATVRFDRTPEQPPMLFRATYEAPDGGATRSVRGCSWLLAEATDVGVACTSDDGVRVLPWLAPGGAAAVE